MVEAKTRDAAPILNAPEIDSTRIFGAEELQGKASEKLPAPGEQRNSQFRNIAVQTIGAILLTLFLFEAAARVLTVAYHPQRGTFNDFDAKLAIAKSSYLGPRTPGGSELDTPIFLLGGSYMQCDVYPELLRAKLMSNGFRTFPKNLGITRSGIIEHMALLKVAMQNSNGRPAIVFYDIFQHSFSRVWQKEPQATSTDFLHTYAGRKYGGVKLDLLSKVELFLEDNFYLVRHRNFIRDQLTGACSILFDPDGEYDRTVVYGSSTQTLSVSSLGRVFYGSPVFGPAQYKRYFPQAHMQWAPDDWTSAPIDPLKKYCAEHNARLVLIWLPECFAHYDRTPGYAARERTMKTYLESLADNKKVWFIDAHNIDLDPTHFRDPHHCNDLGSIATTEYLAKLLLTPKYHKILEGPEYQ